MTRTGDDADVAVGDLATREPGETPADPYENTDLASLPDWWRRAVRDFADHDLRPYRPPRFADGELKHDVVAWLESAYGVSIGVRGINVAYGDDWTVTVDGDPVATVARRRDPRGYTVYESTAEEFVETIEAALDGVPSEPESDEFGEPDEPEN